MAKTKGLTLKQKRFVDEYIKNGGHGTFAAEKAGYSKNTAAEIASENLTKPKIKQYFEDSLRNIEEKLGITAEWKAKMLKRCATRCMPKNKGERMRPTGMIQAIAELNKMQGHYSPVKTEIKADVTNRDDIERARKIVRDNFIKPQRSDSSEKNA